MKLVERLGKLERTLALAGLAHDAGTVRAAIARIEAADETVAETDHRGRRNKAIQRYRALDLDRIAAASRLLERERCVAALATHLFDGSESMIVARAEARRILEDK